ncbi:MAG: tetratricopeptide repeat protein [Candidatus Hydrogenedentota bacterium]
MRLYLPLLLTNFIAVSMGCCSLGIADSEVRYGDTASASPRAKAYSRYLSAIVHERRGDYDEALADMNLVTELDPDAATPALRLVRVHLGRQEFEEALTHMEAVVDARPDNARYWALLGEIYHQVGRDEDAARVLHKAVNLDPEDKRVFNALARLEEEMNDLVSTTELYERLTQMDPESAYFHYKLGFNLFRLDEYDAARTAMEKALALKSNYVPARLLLGIINLESGEAADAILHLRRYLIRRPEDIRAREHLAIALARVGDYREAAQELTELVQGAGARPLHHLMIMYCLLRAGDSGEAVRFMPPEGAPYFGTLLRAMARRDTDEPVAPLLETFDTIEGDLDSECNVYLNELLFSFGEESAGDYLLAAIEEFRAMEDGKGLAIIEARLYMLRENYATAVDMLERIVAKHGADVNLHYYLAVAYQELENFEKTEEHLVAYLKEEPDDHEVLNFLGYLYAEEGVKLRKAERLLQRALEFEPESPFYLDSLGWIYYKRGDAEKAVSYIQRALLNMEGDDAILREHLGDAYLAAGEVEKAVREWEKAHRLDPEIEGVAEKIAQHRKEEDAT